MSRSSSVSKSHFALGSLPLDAHTAAPEKTLRMTFFG